jgi:ComF family protein
MLFDALLRFAFPPACPGCFAATDDDLLCEDCLRTVPFREGLPDVEAAGVDSVTAPCRYAGVVRALIVRLKYAGDRHPLKALTALWPNLHEIAPALGRPDSVVPVPMAWRRRRRRGFNQAELLARVAADALRVPLLARSLRRRGARPPQAGLGREARFANVRDAFAAEDGVFGRATLLVDDVATTGATLAACAAALRAAGARRVTALVIAATDEGRHGTAPRT